ncbi:hypothetical protein [Heliophilum fasciatum]|nr:hypothetical protein [Heliophilum fasciatum]MCW2279475.1 hypothetical protein [Heliophilum fasciatum]
MTNSDLLVAPVQANAKWQVGEEVEPSRLRQATSLSQGQTLTVTEGETMFFSNVPELVKKEGFMTRVDNVISQTGNTRVLSSHFNLLVARQKGREYSLPAKMGIVFVNNTHRTVDIVAKKLANGTSKLPDGTRIYANDLAPMIPGETLEVYYGTELGNVILANYFKDNQGERLWQTIEPGQKSWLYDEVGIHGWQMIMGDFVFKDHHTGEILNLHNLSAGEAIGVCSFVAKRNTDLDAFYRLHQNKILEQADNEAFHMRGLINQGINRQVTLKYNSRSDQIKSITFNTALNARAHDPAQPGYEPTKFTNDLTYGYDDYARISSYGHGEGAFVQNNGSYGALYHVTLHITGPTAIALQGNVPKGQGLGYVDLYNQFLTVALDNTPEPVKTVRIVDPHYFSYYENPSQLRELGYGQIVYTLDEERERTYHLTIGLAPNAYGPYKIFLLPIDK